MKQQHKQGSGRENMQDNAHILQDQVQQAITEQQPLSIRGGNSKAFYGFTVQGNVLDTTGHSGIIEYEPTELVLRARAGTPLSEIEALLEQHQQMLGCEPPYFSPKATLGGVVAAGLSGPSRPYRASIQDTILGCTILNGQAQILGFGGKVMKNVAGYDVSRLMAGSMGCLGIILDVTLKVIPSSKAEKTFVFSIEPEQSLAFINDLRKRGLPLSASCQLSGQLMVRFSAGIKEIAGLETRLTAHYSFIEWIESDDQTFWKNLREHKLPFFDQASTLWRLSLPADADVSALADNPEDVLTEWGGCLHWMKTTKPASEIFKHAAANNGQATFFRYPLKEPPVSIFQPLQPPLAQWHKTLKAAFDPLSIFNPGKMYAKTE